jgi:hypothetical protein
VDQRAAFMPRFAFSGAGQALGGGGGSGGGGRAAGYGAY